MAEEKKVEKTESDIKVEEFVKKLTDLEKEYREFCVLYAVNVISTDGEINQIIKLRKLK